MRISILLCLLWANACWAVSFNFEKGSQSRFANPHDLVLGPQGKRIYVADLGNDQIQVLNANTLEPQNNIGQGLLSSPHDVHIEKDTIYVADTGNDRIALFSMQGKVVGELAGLAGPEGVSVSGKRIYFTNTASDQIGYFINGKISKLIGKTGGGKSEFIRPHDIEVSGKRVYVGDPGNNRIVWFDLDLNYLGELQKDFKEPKYLALDKRGYLYVADQHQNRLRIFNKQGKWLVDIRQAQGKKLNRLEGVEVVGQRLWIADTYNQRILRFSIK